MNRKKLFQETQRFNQWWIWVILIGINIPFAIGIYTQIIKGESFGDKPMSNLGLVLITVFMVLFVLLFLSFNLKTEVTKDKIYFKFFPFHIKEREYLISDIQEMKVVKYSPFGDYGGWGIRGIGNDRAFNVRGNMGLKIIFKDGKKRLIGTQKPEELQKIIIDLGF